MDLIRRSIAETARSLVRIRDATTVSKQPVRVNEVPLSLTLPREGGGNAAVDFRGAQRLVDVVGDTTAIWIKAFLGCVIRAQLG